MKQRNVSHEPVIINLLAKSSGVPIFPSLFQFLTFRRLRAWIWTLASSSLPRQKTVKFKQKLRGNKEENSERFMAEIRHAFTRLEREAALPRSVSQEAVLLREEER